MEKTEIIDALLANGYLPKELPPPFKSNKLAEKISQITPVWEQHVAALPPNERRKYPFPSQYARFDMARKGHSRRMLGIPNPINQYHLVEAIAEHWDTLEEIMDRSPISLTAAKIGGDGRAVSMPKLSLLTEKRIKAYATSKAILQTDVLSFYHAIYTHSIPWALHGKRASKRNRNANDPVMFGNKIDALMRSCQDGQTIGIPVGPDTSRIISELILCAVENEIEADRFSTISDGYRYIDDFFLCFRSHVDAESFLAAVREAVLKFDLQLNASKTQILDALDFNESSWPGEISNLSLARFSKDQRRDLIRFFTETIAIAKDRPDESIASFAVRTTTRTLVSRENWDIYEPFLLRLARENSSCLDSVVKILCSYAAAGYPIGDRVKDFAEGMVEDHAPYNHHYEITWTLWLCRSLDIKLGERSTALVARVENSVCACLVLMLRNRRLLTGRGAVSDWTGAVTSDDLKGEHWLLIYEAGIRPSWSLPGAAQAVQDDPFFRTLRDNAVRFFDGAATNLPIKLPSIDLLIENSLGERRAGLLRGAIRAVSRSQGGTRRYDRIGEDYGDDTPDWSSWSGLPTRPGWDDEDEEAPF